MEPTLKSTISFVVQTVCCGDELHNPAETKGHLDSSQTYRPALTPTHARHCRYSMPSSQDVALLGQSGLCNRLGRRLQKWGTGERLSDRSPARFGVYFIRTAFHPSRCQPEHQRERLLHSNPMMVIVGRRRYADYSERPPSVKIG